MSERMVSFLRAHLIDAGQDCFPYQMMTDEEMSAVDGGGTSGLVVRPWIEAQDDIDPGVAVRFGERSLLLRGLLEVDPRQDSGSGSPSIAVSDDLQFLADSRRSGSAYILARSADRDGKRACNYSVQSRIGAFEEQIDTEGFHLFTACTYAAAVRRLGSWALPHVDHHGPETRTQIPTQNWGRWIVNELGVDAVITQIDLFLPGRDPTEPETWMVAHAHGVAILGTREHDTMQLVSVTTSRLEERLSARLSESLGVAF